MIVEAAIATILLTIGISFLNALGMRGWQLLPLGFLVGIAGYIIIQSILIIFSITTLPLVGLGVAAFLAVFYWTMTRFKYSQSVLPSWNVIVYGVGFFAFVAVLYATLEPFFYIKHVDSMEYLAIAGMMAEGTIEEGISLYQFEKRKLAVPILHAPTNSFGQLYNMTIGPLIGMSILGALAWFISNSIKGQTNRTWALLTVGLGILLLVTNNRFIMHALYINSHLLFAGLLMIFVASGWLLATKKPYRFSFKRSLQALQILSIPPLVLARVEAPFIIGIALLPVLSSRNFSVKYKKLLLSVFGISIVTWYGLLFILRYNGEVPSISITGFLILGVVTLAIVPFYKWLDRTKLIKHIVGIGEISIWALLLGFWYWKPEVLYSIVDSFMKNAVYLDSYWGSLFVILVLLTIIMLLLQRFSQQAILRLSVTTFLPFLAILPYLIGGSGYREGGGDSMNRMLFHIVPLAVLFIMVAAAVGKPRIKACYQKIRSQFLPSPSRPSQK